MSIPVAETLPAPVLQEVPAAHPFPTRLVAVGLVLVTLVVFGRMVVNRHGFVMFDDHAYVFENDNVASGLTIVGLGHAFTDVVAANWHPLTIISHMVDVQIFGVDNVWGHHFVTLLIHCANTVLLFLILRRMTKADWPSALVAALFAWHPLHVESVAWLSERKDVLSTFFWLLTMWAYVSYVAAPSWRRYLVVMVWLSLGLLSKPMVVTLPFALMLLDFWPLGRISFQQGTWGEVRRRAWQLFAEKIPMLVVVAIFCVVTLWAQNAQKAVVSMDLVSADVRVINVLMSYNQYVAKTLKPYPLAVPYVLSARKMNWTLASLSAIGLVVVTGLILLASRKRPYLIVGWLWYLGTLVPVVGFVQVGYQSMADRYSYIPLIGLFMMVAYYLPELAAWGELTRRRIVATSLVILAVLAVLSFRQVGLWQDTITLFTHSQWHTQRNHVAHVGLGTGFAEQKRYEEALEQFEIAIEIAPRNAGAHFNRGHALSLLGRPEEAGNEFLLAKALGHAEHTCLFNLGVTYMDRGEYEVAIELAKEAVKIRPIKSSSKLLAICEEKRGNDAEAAKWYEQAIVVYPHDFLLRSRLIFIYAASPDDQARNGKLAKYLADDLVQWFVSLGQSPNPVVLSAQAAAYAECGEFQRAESIAKAALAISEAMAAEGRVDALPLVRKIERQIECYRKKEPYRKIPGDVEATSESNDGQPGLGVK
ncbi:MAG: tetratricopeptide repeat protein [Pirellulales bacterium]|nr:tetratricopeptide repeat protein [Pirellulales bacterium]